MILLTAGKQKRCDRFNKLDIPPIQSIKDIGNKENVFGDSTNKFTNELQ